MVLFKCKMCGGSLEITDETVAVCEYCGTKQTLPKLSSERKAHLYDRANHFRRNNEFDKAAVIYEQILGEDNTDAESYWSLILCRYGIEYVEDPHTHKRVPTVNRTQHRSVLQDKDYLAALEHADSLQAEVYRQEAQTIDEIQQGILAISQKEDPFDVFICYKETDPNGRRTADSVYAQDIYKALTEEGYKVFFSRITLEDKLGTAYEPYIFAALSSAKVMLVVGTKPEHFNAVWVKNEWSRYLAMMESGQKKTIVPIYADMDPYDLPEELSYIQAQDLSKIGFMQDLIHGIQKIIPRQAPVKVVTGVESQMVESMLDKAFHFLRAEDYKSAGLCLDTVYVYDVNHPLYYVGQLMLEHHCKNMMDLAQLPKSIMDSPLYQSALKNADGDLHRQWQNIGNRTLYNEVAALGKKYVKISDLDQVLMRINEIDCGTDTGFADEVAQLKDLVERKIAHQREELRRAEEEQRQREALQAEVERQNAERAKRRKKTFTKILLFLLIALVFLLLFEFWFQPSMAYRRAEEAYAAGDYVLAWENYVASNGYKDAEEKREHLAEILYADEYAEEQAALNKAKVGDVVSFGAYTGEARQPVTTSTEWIVLAKNDGKALLISKQCLTARTYNDKQEQLTGWNQTALGNWLNGEFYKQTFSPQERAGILTNTELNAKVFILSRAEIDACLPARFRSAKATEYAVSHGIQVADNGNSCWWIRNEEEKRGRAYPMLSTGVVGEALYVTNDFVGVRPAIWVTIE